MIGVMQRYGDWFKPSDVPGLVSDYDPDNPALLTLGMGGVVDVLRDPISGIDLDTTAGGRPTTTTISGRTFLDGDGTQDLYGAIAGVAPPFTIFAIFSSQDTDPTQSVIWSMCDLSTFDSFFEGQIAWPSSDFLALGRRDSSNVEQGPSTTNAVVDSQVHLGLWVVNSSTAAGPLRIDNDIANEGGSVSLTDIQPTNIDTFALLAQVDLNPGEYTLGQVGRVLRYSGSLTETQITRITNFLRGKYRFS